MNEVMEERRLGQVADTMETGRVDVWRDKHVLAILQGSADPKEWGHVERNRV